jgi:hypothetical protein
LFQQPNTGIFYPKESSGFFHYHFSQFKQFRAQDASHYLSIDSFIQTPHDRKIACFQIPYPYNQSIEQQIDQLYDYVDEIAVIGCELHPPTVDFIRRFDRPKITYYLCGFLDQPLVHSQCHLFLDWFITSTYFYKHVRPQTLEELQPYSVKPLVFDALLGRKKPHRDQAYTYINTYLRNHGITTYMNSYDTNFVENDSQQWIWESQGIVFKKKIEWTVDFVDYYGHEMSISQIIPIGVYNQTAYTLVAETNVDNDYVFFTEKTVKPILAQRLFITLGNRYTLARLRELGFKTFDGIIDESYDSIEGTEQRFSAALTQLNLLCSQDQTEVLEKCRAIVEHNARHMIETDWYELYFRSQFESLFSKRLTS